MKAKMKRVLRWLKDLLNHIGWACAYAESGAALWRHIFKEEPREDIRRRD